jgi:mannan endo-1,4-beta-mannosidase
MTRGRASSYGTFIGALSLAAVVASLYLSPLGTSPDHKKAMAESDSRVTSVSKASDKKAPAKTTQKQDSPSTKGTSPVRTLTRTQPGSVVKDIVYVPSSTSKPNGTTTTAPTGPSGSTTTTTVPTRFSTYSVPTKSALLSPDTDYWGVSITGVPQGTSQLNGFDSEVEEAPSELTWYQGWDEPYPTQTVENSWQHGALPMITWESKPTNDTDPAQSDPAYSLSDIINGNYDAYLQTFAAAVAAEGLPVVIRLDQEMNGNWFPWSEGVNGNTAGQFVQMWQHVWNIFQTAGANNDVIWLWAPNRVDNLPHAPALSELYPGDGYVDWLGIDAYWRYTTEAPTFSSVFGESFADLATVSNKPIFIAETAGIETNPTTGGDVGSDKVDYTSSLLQGIESDPQIVGFSWFNNVASSDEDGVAITNDWRVDSSAANLVAFKAALATGPFASGLMPASTPVQVVPPPGG